MKITAAEEKKKTIESIFIAKGLGVLLVVFGHYNPASPPKYWVDFHHIIYKFHMPLFFIISGYLLGSKKLGFDDYLPFLHKKIKRLVYHFFTIATLAFIIKYFSGMFFKLQQPVSLPSLIQLFINPINSFYPLLWFIHTLFLIFLIFPFFLFVFKKPSVILFLTILLMFLPWMQETPLRTVFFGLPFLAFGYFIKSKINLDDFRLKYNLVVISASLLIFIYFFLNESTLNSSKTLTILSRFILGSSGSLTCLCLASMIAKEKGILTNLTRLIGFYSWSIYLLHPIFESFFRIIYDQIIGRDHSLFLPLALLAISSGLIIPLWIEKNILLRFWVTRKYILGLNS